MPTQPVTSGCICCVRAAPIQTRPAPTNVFTPAPAHSRKRGGEASALPQKARASIPGQRNANASSRTGLATFPERTNRIIVIHFAPKKSAKAIIHIRTQAGSARPKLTARAIGNRAGTPPSAPAGKRARIERRLHSTHTQAFVLFISVISVFTEIVLKKKRNCGLRTHSNAL
jgi:hypothetical protein